MNKVDQRADIGIREIVEFSASTPPMLTDTTNARELHTCGIERVPELIQDRIRHGLCIPHWRS